MIYVTGDTHAIEGKWVQDIEPVLSSGDIIIVAGDFGIGFWKGPYGDEEAFLDRISGKDYTVLFIDGNHENFNKLDSYPVEEWNGGKVRKIRHNIIHLMRGEIYNIEGLSFFTFGGGYSMDKDFRAENVDWWPQEMPLEEETDYAYENLERAGYKVDYIITHTAPDETVYYLSTIRSLKIKGFVQEEFPLTSFLNKVQMMTEYTHWYFGHLHVDREMWRNQTAIFNCVRELQTGKIVKEWETWEV